MCDIDGDKVLINWEDIINTDDEQELKNIKLWLFQENIRLQNEKADIETKQKKLEEETLFFNKKLEILKDGFRKLEEDRTYFETEKKRFEYKKKWDKDSNENKQKQHNENRRNNDFQYNSKNISSESLAGLLFRNINNPLVLRKRYKDLLKIYHPDNFGGDSELVQNINKEYLKRKDYMQR